MLLASNFGMQDWDGTFLLLLGLQGNTKRVQHSHTVCDLYQ